MFVPTRSTVASAAVITRSPVAGGSFVPGSGIASAATIVPGNANTTARERTRTRSRRGFLLVEIGRFMTPALPSLEIQLQRFGEIMPGVHPGVTAFSHEGLVLNLLSLQVIIELHCLLV